MDELREMEWLVKRRSEIQALLIRVYGTIGEESPAPSATASVKFLLVGVGYSLWRAVFLAESTRSWETVGKHAKQFLQKLIKDNAIGYYQELGTREWTVGYYLNSAYYRLDRGYKILRLHTALRQRVHEFINLQGAPGFEPALMDHWDTAQQAAIELLEHAAV